MARSRRGDGVGSSRHAIADRADVPREQQSGHHDEPNRLGPKCVPTHCPQSLLRTGETRGHPTLWSRPRLHLEVGPAMNALATDRQSLEISHPSLSVKGGAGFPDRHNTLTHNDLNRFRQSGIWTIRQRCRIVDKSLSVNQLLSFSFGIRQALPHRRCRILPLPRRVS